MYTCVHVTHRAASLELASQALNVVLSTLFAAWPSLSSSLVVTSADLWIDDHHAVEDIGITLGQVGTLNASQLRP